MGSGICIRGREATDNTAGARYAGEAAGHVKENNASITGCRNAGRLELPEAGSYLGRTAGYITGTGNKATPCENVGTIIGTGGYLEGIIGGIESGSGIVTGGCRNNENGTVSNGGKRNTGGVLGGTISGGTTVWSNYNQGTADGGAIGTNAKGIAGSMTAEASVAGYYNAGLVTGAGTRGTARSITGVNPGSGNITFCYCVAGNSYPTASYPADRDATGVEGAAFRCQGAAFTLNGGRLGQTTGISWTYQTGNDYPSYGTLKRATNWEQIEGSIGYDLIKDEEKPLGDGDVDPYEITTPEQLAWFAYQVNERAQNGICGMLMDDIDMKAAESRYIAEGGGRLGRIPIGGTDGSYKGPNYQGVFTSRNEPGSSNPRSICQIRNLYVNNKLFRRLFGMLHDGVDISRIGLSNAEIIGGGDDASGIAGAIRTDNDAPASRITQCYNQSENGGEGSITGESAEGILGRLGNGIIQNCYNLEAAIVGGSGEEIIGTSLYPGRRIWNSYNTCGKKGSITFYTSEFTTGAVVGGSRIPTQLIQCCSGITKDSSGGELVDKDGILPLYSTGNENLKVQTEGLNTLAGTIRILDDRIWYTSLVSEAERGFPTLVPPIMINAGEAIPGEDTDGGEGVPLNLEDALGGTVSIASAMFHYASQELTSDAPAILADWKTEYYHSYGETNANGKIGLAKVAGSTDKALDPTKISLESSSQGLGMVSGLKPYTGAACTYPADRGILVELSSGTTRYEIRFTIKGVGSKSLVVDSPVDVTVEKLIPSGKEETASSVNVVMKNNHAYPMGGKIPTVTPISRTDRNSYRELEPITKNNSYGGRQIYDSGVRLGITNPKAGTEVTSGELYYNPEAAGGTNPWMGCQLKAGEIFQYRYFLKYKSNPYYDREHPDFGYTISYQSGVMAGDYSSTTDAVA